MSAHISTQSFGKKALKAYFRSIRNLELIPVLSIVSLCLSILCFSRVFGFLLLNFAYVINISFFIFLINGSFAQRRTNIYPLFFSSLSILLSVPIFWGMTSALAELSNLAHGLKSFLE